MCDEVLEYLYRRYKDQIIKSNSFEEFKKDYSGMYANYVRFEPAYNTVKHHPTEEFCKLLVQPQITSMSELFEELVYVYSNARMKDPLNTPGKGYYPVGTTCLNSDYFHGYVELSKCDRKMVTWVNTYGKLKEEFVKDLDDSFGYGLGSFDLCEKGSGKLLIANGGRCIGSQWITIIKENDLEIKTLDTYYVTKEIN